MWRIEPGNAVTGRRSVIMDVLRARPGLCFREVVRATGLVGGTTAHHLAVLERHGLAWSIRHSSKRRSFAGPRPTDEVAGYLARCAGLDAGLRSLLAFVAANPGCIQKTVIEAFAAGRPASTVQHQLARLERDGFVTRAASGRCWRHYAAPPSEAVLVHRGGDEVVQTLARASLSIVPAGLAGTAEATA